MRRKEGRKKEIKKKKGRRGEETKRLIGKWNFLCEPQSGDMFVVNDVLALYLSLVDAICLFKRDVGNLRTASGQY